MSKKPLLSADALGVMQGVLDDRIVHLDKLHDHATAFGAGQPFWTNLAAERSRVLKARNEVGAAFEAQFPAK